MAGADEATTVWLNDSLVVKFLILPGLREKTRIFRSDLKTSLRRNTEVLTIITQHKRKIIL